MQYGVCCGPDKAGMVAKAGYDYFEWSVGGLLKPQESETEFNKALEQVKVAPIPCPVVNCFIPGSLKITGPEVDFAALVGYVTKAFERAKIAGIDTIVFGSGGARAIPEGFSRERAWEQLVDFGMMFAPIAAAFDVTVVMEPLNKAECNVLTTVGEGAKLVKEVGHKNFRLLVDAYHWGKDGDSSSELVESGSLIKHSHIATYVNRMAPGAEECDFSEFFSCMDKFNYTGRISFEGKTDDFETEIVKAIEVMKSYCKQCCSA
ncbi:MAG: sugar phosphate isomerase/epimerase [Planctomycetes bacterium]|nr:sugar phosphate isomerase/epimerase [Planctomycetota bacterium]